MDNKDAMEMDLEMNTVKDLNFSYSSGPNRFRTFQILMKKTLDEVVSGVSEEMYLNLFGSLSALQKNKSAPKKIHNKMKTILMKSLNSEIEQMVQEEQIEEKFNKLDSLVEESALYEEKDAWRPNGNVNDHIRSHVMEKKLKHVSTLREYVREKEHATESLKQQVSQLRAQVHEAETALRQLSELCLDTSVLDKIDKNISEGMLTNK